MDRPAFLPACLVFALVGTGWRRSNRTTIQGGIGNAFTYCTAVAGHGAVHSSQAVAATPTPPLNEICRDDGANVDGTGWVPPLKPAFFGQVVDGLKHDFRIGAAGVKTLKATGTLSNQGSSDTMALAAAVYCGDVATLDVLLRHHLNVAQREAPNIVAALTQATGDGNAAMVQRLLDHGADPCADDRTWLRFTPSIRTDPRIRLRRSAAAPSFPLHWSFD